MNRYSRGPSFGGPSKATASTTCQKCLKKDIYECKAVVQERPYVSRPSRTQQLLDPKLVPKLTNDAPQDLLRKQGIADEQLAKLEEERGRKHDRQSEDPDVGGASKRMRSASFASSTSVSTISTNISRSPSPRSAPGNTAGDRNYYASRSHSPPTRDTGRSRTRKRSPSPPPRVQPTDPEKKRRRESFSSAESRTSKDGKYNRPGSGSRERTSSRSTRRKFKETSPPVRGRRTESRSPHGDRRRRMSHDRRHEDNWEKPNHRNGRPLPNNNAGDYRGTRKERSLSPFSKRLALTQSMNR